MSSNVQTVSVSSDEVRPLAEALIRTILQANTTRPVALAALLACVYRLEITGDFDWAQCLTVVGGWSLQLATAQLDLPEV